MSRQPQRGVILDCRGRVLAASNQIQTIFAEPRIISNVELLSAKLAEIIDVQESVICDTITTSSNLGFAKIKVDATIQQCDAARKLYGIGIQSQWTRYFPMAALVSHVVGFTSIDNRGLGGIELEFDKELSGSAGLNIFQADARKRPICLDQQEGVLKDGMGVVLTIDATIQQFAREELLKQYRDFEAESAVAIVAEPDSGAILAMVSLPDFNPNQISSQDPNSFRNRALTDTFEPGSIFKPLVMAIALDGGVINKDEKIFCENGSYRGKGFGRIGEYRDHKYGNLALREVLIKSSNIGMAKIGQKLGKDKLYKGLKLFGFGEKTNIELSGEEVGLLRDVDKWTGYSITRIPFGQEISVTAIQIVRAYCMLANGGLMVRPFLVKAMVDNNGEITRFNDQPPGVGYVIKPEAANWIVNDALVGVVNERSAGGTGWRAKLDRWQVFGKTGTADIAKSDGSGYSDSDCIASFVCGAPAEKPRIIVMVSIRKPNKKLGKGYTGGVVASPVARQIVEKTMNYLERGRV